MSQPPTSRPPTSDPLGVGDRVPDLTLRDQHGADLRLADLRGAPALVVFYPYAFSGVCTSELRDLARSDELAAALDRTGAALVGVSCDPVFTQRAFADAEGLDFPLLSDFWPHGALAAGFGVLDVKRGCPRRSSFLLDGEGVVRWALHHGIGDPRTVAQHLAALDVLA
jgi:peroxiredoxin